MIFLYFLALSSSLYTGFLIFNIFSRTYSNFFFKISFIVLFCEVLLLLSFHQLDYLMNLILYTPLFIGFFPFLLSFLTVFKRRSKSYQTTLTLLECISIHLQIGQSFINSLTLALKNLPPNSSIDISFKKNVIVQQLKSRNCTIFNELTRDLNTLSQQNLGKQELLSFIKYKFQLNSELEQKINLSSIQYKTQSCALIFFWLASFSSLFLQNQFFLHLNIILISLLMMTLGLLLAKKMIVKVNFRI